MSVQKARDAPAPPSPSQQLSISRLIPRFLAELDCGLINQPSNSEPLMKTKQTLARTTITTFWNSLLLLLLGTLLAAQAHGQIYVSDYINGTVGEYHLDGTAISASLIAGLHEPTGLTLSGNDLYVISYGAGTDGTVGIYNATTGAAIKPSLVTSLAGPEVAALSGNSLYVVNPGASGEGTGLVGVYNARTGAVIAAPLLTGLIYPVGIAISGNYLYLPQQLNLIFGYINVYDATTGALIISPLVSGLLHQPLGLLLWKNCLFEANGTDGTIGKYDATTGAVINASFISGLNGPNQLALLGERLFVSNSGNGTIGEYDAKTGAAINPSLISGLNFPFGIAIRRPRWGN